jgi:hypothetical protein
VPSRRILEGAIRRRRANLNRCGTVAPTVRHPFPKGPTAWLMPLDMTEGESGVNGLVKKWWSMMIELMGTGGIVREIGISRAEREGGGG